MMTGRRMVTAEVIPERILDVGTLGEEPKDQDIWREKEKMDSLMGGGVHPTAEVSDVEKVWVGKRESMQYQSLKNVLESSKQTMSGGMDSLGGYIQSQAKRPQNVSNGPSLVRPFTGITGTVGELLYILRPVAYVMLLRKFGRKSWKPWVISLAIETASRIMVVRDLEFGSITSKLRRGEDQSFDWKREIETEELSRRRNMFIYYVLRSPVFEKYVE
ncbi:Peroxisome biogenesis factor 16 [Zancudomyces culisetae]|uniref:Peroxisomal membrane protein PEX16 n=1 Tax=Zancudomyces culisetae TaxID=1213189 RepID=A0A1R1PZE2_ZANCU|nr:Peroxisome biogenesis factor 16 [Zancudomyces culisetae]|eukprot:OMH86338.1 Peroxisome biogenesis factor 16 [Zancudomyces culisetae]